MRRVRGTRLDVFGWDRDRRLERSLIAEYEGLVESLLYDAVVRVSEAALSIKGYADIKAAAAAAWRAEVARIGDEVASRDAEPAK